MSALFASFKLRAGEALNSLRKFARDDRGIVAVEWVAIAGVVGIGAIAALYYLTNSLNTPASAISGNLSDCETWASANSASTSGCN